MLLTCPFRKNDQVYNTVPKIVTQERSNHTAKSCAAVKCSIFCDENGRMIMKISSHHRHIITYKLLYAYGSHTDQFPMTAENDDIFKFPCHKGSLKF